MKKKKYDTHAYASRHKSVGIVTKRTLFSKHSAIAEGNI